MALAPFDWFLAFILIIGLAWWARREQLRIQVGLGRGRGQARLAGYRRLIVVQWSLVGFLALHWALRSRPLADLGLTLPLDYRMLAGVILALSGTGLLWRQLRDVQRHEESRAEAREALRDLAWLLPHSTRELDLFVRVSFTAGICEELLYRGFLAWFLATWMPLWVAMIVAGVLFGVAHLYQGPVGVLKTGVVGLVLGGLTLLSGSILPAMILHTAVDLLNGRLAHVALTTPRPIPLTAPPPAPTPETDLTDHA